MLKLEATTSNEKIILDYLNANASDALREKINGGKKTLKQCWAYITAQAKKQAKNGCAVIDDATVFGWAVHFFEEDSIKAETVKSSDVAKPKKQTKKPEKKAPIKVPAEQVQSNQLTIFDLV